MDEWDAYVERVKRERRERREGARLHRFNAESGHVWSIILSPILWPLIGLVCLYVWVRSKLGLDS